MYHRAIWPSIGRQAQGRAGRSGHRIKLPVGPFKHALRWALLQTKILLQRTRLL